MKVKKNIVEIENRLEQISLEKEELLKEALKIEGEHLKSYGIRPAGRHLLTIGEDLIQDPYAAIVELVKNCYDADSPDAKIVFKKRAEEGYLEIRIEDHGHGMSTDDVVNKWLVPSTNYKLETRISPLGRTMQGRKGIGRYAASILGDDLKLETTDENGIETTLQIQWQKLAQYEYLDQIRIPVSTQKTGRKAGTILVIHSRLTENTYWNKRTFQKLRFELKKLIPPKIEGIDETSFQIILSVDGFDSNECDSFTESIAPYPILDFYDYRISGEVTADGICILKYENKKVKNGTTEDIRLNMGSTDCGALKIDIRVYDRDKDAIDQLISRGLHDEQGNYVSKQQARQLLNDVNGIGVYRNGFRIRPLGDADFDWLKLNEQRVQNPSLRVGSNQVVGYVHIESEEKSGLEEKSARDGLKNNHAYVALKSITCKIIQELESRRYSFRRKVGLNNPKKKLERQLEGLYDYSELEKNVKDILNKADISGVIIGEITEIILQEEYQKNRAIEEIRHTVAVYQGQATLGKIVNVILHEGRKPLNYIKNQTPNLKYYGEKFEENKDPNLSTKIIRIADGISENGDMFVELFGRLDPLAAKRRETKKEFSLKDAIEIALDVYKEEFKKEKIRVSLECSKDITIVGWKQDIYIILVNLLENSLYWITEKRCDIRNINITVVREGEGFTLSYKDSGPGINDTLLESGVIFDPEFTTKPQGTGLGLAIAGEAATRNGLRLSAIQCEAGAHFILSTKN